MTRIDFERQPIQQAVWNAEEQVREARWNLMCYDNRAILATHKLQSGKDYEFGTGENILYSSNSLEKCVFDGKPLKIFSPIMGGTRQEDHALYRCPKCHVKYHAPLTPKDKKSHDKRMRTMVFG